MKVQRNSQKKPRKHLHIALLGMYGGMWKEYNPGCYFTGLKTYQEMQKRFPAATIDIFAIHSKLKGKRIVTENRFHQLNIHFFSRAMQMDLLEKKLRNYDVLIIGGDIVWGGDDVMNDHDIFFLQSKKFLATKQPLVLFNCMHTFYDDQRIKGVRGKFIDACNRAAYVSVRTKAIRRRLQKNGIKQRIYFVPDLVLDVDLKTFTAPTIPATTHKPKLGISIRNKLSKGLITFLRETDLSAYEVYLFAFSRQYDNLKTLKLIKKIFKYQFHYIENYFDPMNSFKLIGCFDVLINDTFHGITAAILQQIPFISIDVEPEKTSRKDQLLEAVGISKERNIRVWNYNTKNYKIMSQKIQALLTKKITLHPKKRTNARMLIRKHFDAMEKTIRSHTSQR